MIALRRLVLQGISALPDSWEGPVRRAIALTRQRLGRWNYRDRRPVELPGSGTIVLVDARGLHGDEIVASMTDALPTGAVRIVLLIDDPRVHLYRSASVSAVEYLPVAMPPFCVATADERVAALRHTYRVEHTVVAGRRAAGNDHNGHVIK